MKPNVLGHETGTRPCAKFPGGTVPVPNALFDDLLPTLRDTELRVLLIIIRQTAGWRDHKGRSKARDWISHGQFVRRTGRKSAAVSGAIARLVRRGLIVVEDSAGQSLATPQERRRHLGRLYFRSTYYAGAMDGQAAT
jgi:hypothetical protein